MLSYDFDLNYLSKEDDAPEKRCNLLILCIFATKILKKQIMKKILLSGILFFLMCVSCTEQSAKEDFVTDCEKSDFVKTPRFAETMAWFEKLADYSSMVNVTSFGKSPQGRDLSLVIVDKDGLQDPVQIRQWLNSVSLCPGSFCTPRPNVPVTPGIS